MKPFPASVKRYGRWNVLKPVKKDSKWFAQCICDCGTVRVISLYGLASGHSKSCGCLRREVTTARNIKHGHAIEGGNSRTYTTWLGMHNRCRQKTHASYKYYGARGIRVCKDWESFENFLRDMGDKPVGLTIERINNDLGYSNDNCKWATTIEQAKNKRPEAIKDRCRNGHLYTGENTTINPRGHRNCRQCGRENHRKLYNAKREEGK